MLSVNVEELNVEETVCIYVLFCNSNELVFHFKFSNIQLDALLPNRRAKKFLLILVMVIVSLFILFLQFQVISGLNSNGNGRN
jgi:hypothetical protein